MDDCNLCGGELGVLGVLGNRLHLRCMSCGTDHNTTDPDRIADALTLVDGELEDEQGLRKAKFSLHLLVND